MTSLAAVLAAVLWPAAIAYAAWRLASVALLFAPTVVVTAITETTDSAIPTDLVGLTRQYPDAWAQEDMMQVIRERYAEYKDWNLVRSAMGVAPRLR